MVHEVILRVWELGDLVLIGKRKNLTPREVPLVPPQIALYAAGPVQLFDLYIVIKHNHCFIFITCSNSGKKKKKRKFTYSTIAILLNWQSNERSHKSTRKCDLCTTWKKSYSTDNRRIDLYEFMPTLITEVTIHSQSLGILSLPPSLQFGCQ